MTTGQNSFLNHFRIADIVFSIDASLVHFRPGGPETLKSFPEQVENTLVHILPWQHSYVTHPFDLHLTTLLTSVGSAV